MHPPDRAADTSAGRPASERPEKKMRGEAAVAGRLLAGDVLARGAAFRPDDMLRLTATAGNAHVARRVAVLKRDAARARGGSVLQRQEQVREDVPQKGEKVVPDPSPPHPPIHLQPGMGQLDESMQLFAAIAAKKAADAYDGKGADTALHKMLVYHYVYGGGAPFPLTHDLMTHVIAPGKSERLDLFGGKFPLIKDKMAALEHELPQVCDENGRGSTSAQIADQAVISCDANKPSLGAFTCMVNGTLTANATGGDGSEVTYEFSGTMRWFDVWDFDPHVKATAEQEAKAQIQKRPPSAEKAVRQAHDFLPGAPFNVDSEDVPVTQKSGERAQW